MNTAELIALAESNGLLAVASLCIYFADSEDPAARSWAAGRGCWLTHTLPGQLPDGWPTPGVAVAVAVWEHIERTGNVDALRQYAEMVALLPVTA